MSLSITPRRNLRLASVAALGLVVAAAAIHGGWRMWPGCLPPFGRLELVPPWVGISAIIFIAAVVSGIVGFAFAAIAGALILHYVPNGVEAVQIMMIASIGIQAYSVAGLYRSITWHRCVPFIVGGVITLPVGILILLNLHPRTCVAAMGAALVAYGLYMLLRRPVLVSKGGGTIDVLVGALGGITGPLAAFPGAFVTVWCGMRGWDKVAQRSACQPYILVLQVLGLGALCLVGRQGAFDPVLLAYALPGLAGAVVGLRISHALTDMHFQGMVNLTLVVCGISLVLK